MTEEDRIGEEVDETEEEELKNVFKRLDGYMTYFYILTKWQSVGFRKLVKEKTERENSLSFAFFPWEYSGSYTAYFDW